MSNTNENKPTTVVVQSGKSGAPLICGIIGFVLGIPAILCATVCAAICAGATASASQASGGSGAEGLSFVLPLLGFIATWIVGFVLSFFAKGPKSKKTGAITIVAGVAMMVFAIVFGGFLGIASGILYVISGGIAISNASKPNI